MTRAGGTHVYLSGTNIGSAFAPPDVFIGSRADARCIVQPFTTAKNRLHCIIDAEGLPPPSVQYVEGGSFVTQPLRVVRDGRIAQCWHVGGVNHNCFVRFDVGGTPRVNRLLTPALQSGGVVRLQGHGIDGGVLGSQRMIGTLFRGNGQVVVGACGEKDCAPSSLGVESIGCLSRVGGGGDAVRDENGQVATAFSNHTQFGCKLDALAGASPHAMHVKRPAQTCASRDTYGAEPSCLRRRPTAPKPARFHALRALTVASTLSRSGPRASLSTLSGTVKWSTRSPRSRARPRTLGP